MSGAVFVIFNQPCQTEIGDFTHLVFADEYVGSSHISVNIVHSLNVRHAGGNLKRQYILKSIMSHSLITMRHAAVYKLLESFDKQIDLKVSTKKKTN